MTWIVQRIWFERRFDLGLGVEHAPELLERLRGTPARLEERVREASDLDLEERLDGRWSIQENVGHLLDLEELWYGRIDDLESGAERLRDADLQNRRTHQADHNRARVEGLLAGFRGERMRLVTKLRSMGPDGLRRTALHPRLEQPMSTVDLMFFVAEHDDHHLARVGAIADGLSASS